MSQHTPGPWYVHKDDLSINDRMGDTLFWPYGEFLSKESEANSKLAAASPEMLDALKVAECFMQTLWVHAYGHSKFIENDPDYQQVCAAIKKAEGRI